MKMGRQSRGAEDVGTISGRIVVRDGVFQDDIVIEFTFAVPGDADVLEIESGAVTCLGQNDYGQLGDGTTDFSAEPVSVSSLDDAVSISAGLLHTCALTTGGGVRCWGANERNQLGDGSTIDRTLPVDVIFE